jgi:hypothetical protein
MRNSHANTLFHYTKNFEALSSILKEGFRVSYSKERITDSIFIAIPIVSFCDIPIECCEEHREKYGSYAIGLNKQWMMDTYKELLSPVHYVIHNAPVRGAWKHHEKYVKAVDEVAKYEARKEAAGVKKIKFKNHDGIIYEGYPGYKNNPDDTRLFSFINDLFYAQGLANYSLGITKKYYCKHNGKEFCAYDECEWRILIPEDYDYNGNKAKWYWSEVDYQQWRNNRNDSFLDGFTLDIEPASLDYIIVTTEDEQKSIYNLTKELGWAEQICNIDIRIG